MRANTFLPAPVIRIGLRLPAIKAMSFGALVVHPSRIPVQRAYEDALSMRRGRAFRPVARASRTYEFTGVPEVPVGVGWGAQDRILGVHQLDRVRAQMPYAEAVVLRGCGHVPMSDAPDEVASLILRTARRADVTRGVGDGARP